MKLVNFIFLFFSLMLTNLSFANDIPCTNSSAVQVSPEEFQRLKREEVAEPTADIIPHINVSGSSGSDAAILIFAIVGTVMLVAWVPYAAILTVRAISKPECFDKLHMISADFNFLTGNNSRKGNASDLQYSIFLKEKDSYAAKKMGFNFNLGRYRFKDSENSTYVKYDSYYWLVGPSILFGDTFGLKLDLLAGTAFHRDVNLILKGGFKFFFKFPNNMFAGLGFGADYINGQKGKGLFTHTNDLSTHILGTFGFFF